ncbi:Lnb N-terminal periplasmic domain-containing protein [Geomonas agri]|uniref:Lnb N-terminal periplasmic domain-containing protein n=1 Tax=Geomonas agri TaxID=2873702 RepID=UPI001CD6E7E6|nr:DUF4105 domain-containing protein [Geomonas agri]
MNMTLLRRVLPLLLLLISPSLPVTAADLTVPVAALPAADLRYRDQLIGEAQARRLWEQRPWQILLHYKTTFTGGTVSRISDANFFLAPTGRTDPAAELSATLSAFFQPDAPDGEHPICRFPARLAWLSEELAIDPARLPTPMCSEQQEQIRTIDARSAVLVFPVGHINSPASMFGHTLIRIDGSSKSNLISYAVNYAADANDANGFLYAFKGLTGLYKGYYSLMPYYQKVKEYSDLEHRDMWEYRLKLSREEVNKLLQHALELQRIASDYYFLDENCSYNLLFLIEAARPTLHLSDRTGLIVHPTNTIEIAKESGILEPAVYRPSQGARIVKVASLLDDHGQQAALELSLGKRAPASLDVVAMTDQAKREVLDLAAELVQLRLARKELEQDDYSRLYLKILAQRSALGTGNETAYAVTPPEPPDAGHHTSKVGLGGGVRRGDWYAAIHLQPEFHGLLDPDQSYLRGAQIKFFDTRVDYVPETGRPRLHTLHLLDILSTAPRDRIFKPLSWKVAAGWDTEVMENGRDSLIFRVNSGGGVARRSPLSGIVYGFAEVDVDGGRHLRGTVAVAPGISLGWLEQVREWWKVSLEASAFWYVVGDERISLKATLAQNFRLAQHQSLTLSMSFGDVSGHTFPDHNLLWNYYF